MPTAEESPTTVGHSQAATAEPADFRAALVLRCYDEDGQPFGSSYREVVFVVGGDYVDLPLATLIRDRFSPPEAAGRQVRILEHISAHFEINEINVNIMDLIGAAVAPGQRIEGKLAASEGAVGEPVRGDELLENGHFYIVYLKLIPDSVEMEKHDSTRYDVNAD